MGQENTKISRRNFAKGLAIAPLGLAASSTLGQAAGAQASQPLTEAQMRARIAAILEDRRFIVEEPQPFADTVVFSRREFTPRLQSFALADVELDPGPLADAREWNRGFLLRIPNDRLLRNFRVNAGLPANAQPLGGWEAPNCELRGHFVGHAMSACAHLYSATGDNEIKAKGDGLVAGIAECQTKLDDNGYVSAFPTEFFDRLDRGQPVWAPYYTLHKIMAGLYDMNMLAKNQQALDVLTKLAGWVDAWTAGKSEDHMQMILNVEFGGMNEVLYNVAATTGDDRWARTGDRFTKKIFFTPLALRSDQLQGLHMNTHVPEVIGAARRYELSSDYRFGDLSRFFLDTVTQSRTYATGGSSNNEHWLVQPHRLGDEIKVSAHHQECCCAYNMMKLTRHVYSWEPEARYMDYYERVLLNHRLGAIEPKTGHTMYFLSVAPGAWKGVCTEDDSFWCCTGTGVEEFAKLNNTIYYHDADALYVNLYFASRVHWQDRGVRLRQSTSFPDSDRTELIVEASGDQPWALRLRIPAWTTAANLVSLNGKPLETSGTPGTYLTLNRRWKAGDRVELVMPMRLTAEPLRDDPSRQAFLYGPLVLAGQFPKTGLSEHLDHLQGPELAEAPPLDVPTLKASSADPADWIKPVPGQPLTFRTSGQAQDVTLKPLNQSWERFTVYWTVA
ncbi:MAG TPA: glycoside hydrolase family 127 protein [Terracidiphilus sp.]|nr:glycoside hydrolase family 127 protein [Terracidiphilus sp.]